MSVCYPAIELNNSGRPAVLFCENKKKLNAHSGYKRMALEYIDNKKLNGVIFLDLKKKYEPCYS